MILKHPKADEFHKPLTPNKPEAVLPFGDMLLLLFQTENGYNLVIQDQAGTQQYTGELFADFHHVESLNTTIRSFEFRKLIEHDSPYHQTVYLLSPDNRPAVYQREDGKLYCRVCHCTVPNTANAEMRKDGIFAHNHICGLRSPGEVYDNEN